MKTWDEQLKGIDGNARWAPPIFKGTKDDDGNVTFECRIVLGRRVVAASNGHSTKRAAFSAALEKASARLNNQWQIEKIATHRKNTTQSFVVTSQFAREQWTRELKKLRAIENKSLESLERIRCLQAFIVLLDPLRKHEINYVERRSFIEKIRQEILQMECSLTKEDFLVLAMQKLAGTALPEVGQAVAATGQFRQFAEDHGQTLETMLSILTGTRMLRRDGDGNLTISPIGVNMMERNLEQRGQPGTIGAACGARVKAQLMGIGKPR